jgi:TonB family protein
MSEIWKQCEGQIVDNQFPLLQFLANTNHSAVFLTQALQSGASKAAIKFISADIPAAEEQLGAWRQASLLDHPHVLRLFQSGRFHIAGLDILYVVMELADEDLSRFLPQRALTAAETRELLNPLVDVLSYLHGQGLVHSHIKPSNLLATKDQLKVSSDTIFPVGHARETHRDLDVYDAPENSATPLISAAPADVWSLGVTLVEALTQQVPALPFDDSAELALSETIPEPFHEIARHSLVRDPARRWKISKVAAVLNPATITAAATASTAFAVAAESPAQRTALAPEPRTVARSEASPSVVPPVSAPLSKEPVTLLAKLPEPPAVQTRREKMPPAERITLPSHVIPVVLLGVLVVGAIFTIPKFLHHLSQSAGARNSGRTSVAKSNPAAITKPAEANSATRAAGNVPAAAGEQPKKVEPGTVSTPTPAQNGQAADVVYANSSKNGTVTKSSPASPARGEVLEQVLPQVPAKALATIHGKVRVLVLAQVDAAGSVSAAKLQSAGPSKYFADRALQSAEQWQFSSPVSEGRSLPSQWLIRFEFSRSGVVASPSQVLQ